MFSIADDAIRHPEPTSDTCLRLFLANPRNDGATDLPQPLRRLADQIEAREIAAVGILDLTISHEDGRSWSGTLYWFEANEGATEKYVQSSSASLSWDGAPCDDSCGRASPARWVCADVL